MPTQTFWEKTKTGSKSGFDKLWGWADKLGDPVNNLSNKLGSEAFWPTTLDKESDKAARILRSFCKDGFYAEEERPTPGGPKQKQKVLKKIPASVIRNAKGLAIFTTMRTGLWVSGAGGSGILVGRTATGEWSPPSGILLHTAGLGFLIGVDIYDCVLVLNSQKALDAFAKLRVTVGGEISAVAGPVGAGGILETELHKRQAPIFTYLKSRGFYAGVQVDGTIVVERTDENERFYLQKLSAQQIVSGKVRHPPFECRKLLETIKAAQGDTTFDESLVPMEAPPGDYQVDASGHMFGIPDKDDPDPYGVLQLEKEGLVIREAGTQKRASWEQFTFSPALTSPVYSSFADRSSHERDMKSPSVGRGSGLTGTTATADNASDKSRSTVADTATQTDPLPAPSSPTRSVRSNRPVPARPSIQEIPGRSSAPPSPGPYSPSSPQMTFTNGRRSHLSSETPSSSASAVNDGDDDTADEDDHEHDAIIEEPQVHAIQRAPAAQIQVVNRARMVTVPKRAPPVLPPRNPSRRGPVLVTADGADVSDAGTVSPVTTPTHDDKSELDTPIATATEKLEDVDLSTDEEEEGTSKRNPWAKAMEKRRGESVEGSPASLAASGAFHSLPGTPDEHEFA